MAQGCQNHLLPSNKNKAHSTPVSRFILFIFVWIIYKTLLGLRVPGVYKIPCTVCVGLLTLDWWDKVWMRPKEHQSYICLGLYCGCPPFIEISTQVPVTPSLLSLQNRATVIFLLTSFFLLLLLLLKLCLSFIVLYHSSFAFMVRRRWNILCV